jgi:regulator of protease activity HflC (stomatin/prohibitin superfamily)
MKWSSYEAPDASGTASVSQVSVDKIDMRIQRTFYSYTVRTNDNVRLMLMGTIFWRVTNVSQMVLGTSDPSGDVWHHCRSSFMQALSNTTFDSFMGSFNQLAKVAYERDVADDFYDKRGVALLSMEVTRFEAIDAETKATLKQINEETIKQITLLKKQEGANAVQAAKMRSDIALAKEKAAAELDLEAHKTKLIQTRGENSLIEAKMQAEGDAQPFALHAKSFISALNETGVEIATGLGLYRSLREAEHHNIDTQHLSSGKASLFLTSKDVGLTFRSLNLGDAANSSSGEHNHDL